MLCQMHKKPLRYKLDEHVASSTQHEIVRLPPYHSFYNPIELVWSKAKRYFDAHVGRNNDFSLKQTDEIWAEALESVTPQIWRACCDHTDRRILQDYEREVSDDTEHSYQLHIVCDSDDEEEFMEFTQDGEANIVAETRTMIKQPVGVCRSLLDTFESEMVDIKQYQNNGLLGLSYCMILVTLQVVDESGDTLDSIGLAAPSENKITCRPTGSTAPTYPADVVIIGDVIVSSIDVRVLLLLDISKKSLLCLLQTDLNSKHDRFLPPRTSPCSSPETPSYSSLGTRCCSLPETSSGFSPGTASYSPVEARPCSGSQAPSCSLPETSACSSPNILASLFVSRSAKV